jgi:hypothetical protein
LLPLLLSSLDIPVGIGADKRMYHVYRAYHYLALTKLGNADKPTKKQQTMRPLAVGGMKRAA